MYMHYLTSIIFVPVFPEAFVALSPFLLVLAAAAQGYFFEDGGCKGVNVCCSSLRQLVLVQRSAGT